MKFGFLKNPRGLFLKNPEGRQGGLLQGSLRLVSLWWEFPPWLDSNIRISRFRMQLFSVEEHKTFFMEY